MRKFFEVSGNVRIVGLVILTILSLFLGVIYCDFVLNEFVYSARQFVDYSIYVNDSSFATNWVFGLALAIPAMTLIFFTTKSKLELIPVLAFAYLSAILLAVLSVSYHQIQYSMQDPVPFAYGVLVEAFQLEYCALYGSIFGTIISIYFLKRRERKRFRDESNNDLLDIG